MASSARDAGRTASAPAPLDAPYVPAGVSLAEVTVKGVLLGLVLSVVLGAANMYLGLKAGLTVAAAIPAAVVSMAVLRLFRRHTILENNMVQTIASAGTAVASGILFTIPALLILGAWDTVHYWETTLIGLVGGVLGVLFTVPLRRALIVEERLAFPEGVATAEVLKSGETGGAGVGALLAGGALGAAYKLLQSGLNLWADTSLKVMEAGKAVFGFGTQLSPALLGVGAIVGLRIGTLVVGGSVVAWLVAMPLYSATQGDVAQVVTDPNLCGKTAAALSDVGTVASCLYKYRIRYLGVGAMLVGGVWSLVKLRGPLTRAVAQGLRGARSAAAGPAAEVPRTELELSARATFLGIAALLVPMFLFYAFVTDWNWGVAALMALILVVTGFLFSAVGAYMAGLVGSSNNPISGVTILTLMVSAFALKALGIGSDLGAAATIYVAAIIAVAGSIASDNLQDLKAGHLVGSTPRKQQAMLITGAAFSAFFLAPVLQVLVDGADGIANLNAPQANLMQSIASGIFEPAKAGLPYPIIGLGMLFALLLILVDQTAGRRSPAWRVPVMAVAVGLYLPIDTTAPIFLGGAAAWVAGRLWLRRSGTHLPEGSHPGILFASGLIAGEALLGIVTSALAGARVSLRPSPLAATGLLEWPGLLLLGYIGIVLVHVIVRKARAAPPQP